MLSDFSGAERVYIACGYTDLRQGIDGLASLVQQQFNLDPFTNTLFLFCGRRRDRIKALYWEGNGFVIQENPRFERGFRKAYSYESIRQTLCYNGRGLPTASKAREEKTNGQE